jgi:hypothetical protein
VTLWGQRDLPVLRFLFENKAARVEWFSPRNLVSELGLSRREINLAMQALRDDECITWANEYGDGEGGFDFRDILVLGNGMRALNQWPSEPGLTPERLASKLEQLSQDAPPEAAQGIGRYVARIRGLGLDAFGKLVSAWLNAQIRKRTGG